MFFYYICIITRNTDNDMDMIRNRILKVRLRVIKEFAKTKNIEYKDMFFKHYSMQKNYILLSNLSSSIAITSIALAYQMEMYNIFITKLNDISYGFLKTIFKTNILFHYNDEEHLKSLIDEMNEYSILFFGNYTVNEYKTILINNDVILSMTTINKLTFKKENEYKKDLMDIDDFIKEYKELYKSFENKILL